MEMASQDLEWAGLQDTATITSPTTISPPATATATAMREQALPEQVLQLLQVMAQTSFLTGAKVALATAVLTTQP